MCKKGLVWLLVVAFLSFVVQPRTAGAETVPPDVQVPEPAETEPALTPGISGANDTTTETFSVREALEVAQAQGAQEAFREESTGIKADGREAAAVKTPPQEGLSTGAKIAIASVLVGAVVVAIAVVAAGSRSGGNGLSGVKLNCGK